MPKASEYFEGGVKVFKRRHRSDIMALKALYTGTASERQQKMALQFVIKTLCRADEINYFPDDRDTCFALGREATGKIIRGLVLDPTWTQEDDK